MNMVPLSEVASLDRKGVHPSEVSPETSYIGLEHIERGGRILPHPQAGDIDLKSSKFYFSPEHILYGKLRPNLGKISRPDFAGICSTDILPLRPHAELDRGYLAHYLSQPEMIRYATSRTTGVNLPRLSPSSLAKFPIPLPPLDEQRRIAAILDQADAIRAKRHLEISKYEDLKRALFSDLLSKASELRRIPLQEAYWFQEGPGVRKWQFTRSGVKLLNVGNIESNGKLNLSKTDKYVSEEEAAGRYRHFLVDSGDLVMASSGISIQPDGLLATRSAFVDAKNLPLCMNTSTIRFKNVESTSTLVYLHGWLQSKQFRAQITRLVTGSAQKNFGPSHLRKLYIDLPDTDTQKRYADNIRSINEQSTLTQRALDRDDELFASLQSRAFRGEL